MKPVLYCLLLSCLTFPLAAQSLINLRVLASDRVKERVRLYTVDPIAKSTGWLQQKSQE